jgi:hypothetical protein
MRTLEPRTEIIVETFRFPALDLVILELSQHHNLAAVWALHV